MKEDLIDTFKISRLVAADIAGCLDDTGRRELDAWLREADENQAVGEHGHGVVRRAGEQRDAHGEQHAAEQSLGQEGLELGSRAGTAEVKEDDVDCKAERDQRREQVNVGPQDGVELDGAQPLKAGQAAEHLGHEGRNGDGLPRAQDAVAQGQKPSGDVAQRTAKATIDILDDAA